VSRRSPAFIACAVALPVAVLVAILVALLLSGRGGADHTPVAVAAEPAPAAGGADCARLMAALPARLGDLRAVAVAPPAPAAVGAWRPDQGGAPVVLRCGLPRPSEFTVTSDIQYVDTVQWFEAKTDRGSSVWYTVDRAVFVSLRLPDSYGPTPIQVISDTIARTLPARTPQPAPLPN
jgi:hypothetical protein